MTFRERIDAGEFENKFTYPTGPNVVAARDAYRAEDQRLRQLFKAALLKEFELTDHPRAERFWQLCWEEGHSSGYGEVYNMALSLFDLIKPGPVDNVTEATLLIWSVMTYFVNTGYSAVMAKQFAQLQKARCLLEGKPVPPEVEQRLQ